MTAPAPAGPSSHDRFTRTSPGVVLAWVVATALVAGRLGGPLAGWTSAVGTGAHEIGHAATADVLAGDVVGITVFRDGGGVTVSDRTESGWRRFVVAAAGYPTTLLAALALLTGALLGRTGRGVAGAGAAVAVVALVLWVPRGPPAPDIAAGDQRFTMVVFAVAAVVLASAAAIPDRHSTARRVLLGAFAAGLLTDALRATDDLLAITDEAGRRTTTDADGLAAVVDVGSPGAWAWLMRALLLVTTAAWAWWLVGRWGKAAPPGRPGRTGPTGSPGRGGE